MASTGTYNYSPSAGELVLVAFGRIGLRRTQLNAQHFADANDEANLVQVKISNRQPNLWTSVLESLLLTPGTGTYLMPGNIIAIQSAFITLTTGGTSTDRIIWGLSTFEYSALPQKNQTGTPTSFWYNRQITPQISLWPVPDSAAVYTINLRCLSQVQDINLASGTNLNLPYRWLDVFVADLAYRLARIYAPEREQLRKMDAEEAWQNAAVEDEERVPMLISPGLGSYYN